MINSRLITLKTLIGYELKELDQYLQEDKQESLLSDLHNLFIIKKGILEKSKKDKNYINSNKFHDENSALKSFKLNLIKSISEL